MNTANAFGFLLLGLVMWLLPVVAPGMFPQVGIDGSSARSLWIQTMAGVHVALGAGFLARNIVLPEIRYWLRSAPVAEPVWRNEPVPAEALAIDVAAAEAALSEQGALIAARSLEADGVITLRGKHAALWRALKVAFLDQERFVHFLERLRLLAHRHRDRAHAHWAAPVIFGHDPEHALVHLIETSGIDLQQLERGGRHWLRNMTSGTFLREVADEIDQVVGDARRAA